MAGGVFPPRRRDHGLPDAGRPQGHLDRHAQRQGRQLRQAEQQEAAKRPQVSFVDVWSMFQSPSGGYADYIVDDDGQAKLMRQNDGFHLNLDGANKLARAIEGQIEAEIKARGGKLG
jgi:hypothetical protein